MKRQFQAFSYKVENKADDTLDVHIDGIIVDASTQQILKNWFGDDTSVSYKSFRNQVIDAKPKVLNVYINSDGGMVTDAMAIRDFLSSLESDGVTVNRIGRGVIASAATFPLMGKNSRMSANSWFMIHNVSGGAFGDVNMVESYARTMRKFNDSAVDTYSKATGLSATVIGNMMDQETWMSASEAKEKGFVSALEGDVPFTNKISPDAWPYTNMAVLNSYNAAVRDPKDAGSDHTSFFTELKNGFMKFFEQLTASVTTAKADDKFKNIAGREDILNMIQTVLTPFANKIDEHIEAVKPAEDKKPVEDKKPAEDKKPVEDKKPSDENKPEEESEIVKLRNELNDMKSAMADKLGKPIPEADKTKNTASKFNIEH